jgi:hypothetical protein
MAMTQMSDPQLFVIPEFLPPLRRPPLLVAAARAGQAGWRRQRDLPRLLRCEICPGHSLALSLLRREEAELNRIRLQREAIYDLQRHVLILIAILAEMNAIAARSPQAAISGRGTAIPARP